MVHCMINEVNPVPACFSPWSSGDFSGLPGLLVAGQGRLAGARKHEAILTFMMRSVCKSAGIAVF